eukprot:COSAG02_NODE_29887_length_561_cov_0.755411_2_plen_35_part_01
MQPTFISTHHLRPFESLLCLAFLLTVATVALLGLG